MPSDRASAGQDASAKPPAADKKITLFILLAAIIIAAVGTRPYAGGWNDGTRLATVEALVDHHTWAIDDSIFVKVPQQTGKPAPYPATEPALLQFGTLDKMWIDGHFYSDKSPVPQLCMAGVYAVLQQTTGLVA